MSDIGQQVIVRQGRQPHVAAGAIGGTGCYVDDDGRATVILGVSPSGEDGARHHFHQGDRFELGDEVWEVTEIQSPGASYWSSTVTRVS